LAQANGISRSIVVTTLSGRMATSGDRGFEVVEELRDDKATIPSDVAKYLGEFVGTYLLVLTVGCNVLTGSPEWAVTSIACTLMVSIYALAGVSGANFNPAVSFALSLVKVGGKPVLAMNEALIYICVQLLAGILAGLTYGVTLWKVFNLAPTPGFEWYQAGLAELLYTFMLVFVVLNHACAQKGNQHFGLAIGFVVVAGGYGAGHISGGCFNPAVAFGIDVSSAGIGFGWCFVYTIFELAGAALAAALFRIVRPETPAVSLPIVRPATLCSEFLGTFMLVLTVGLNVIAGSKAPAFSIAAALMCMIYALGDVSGGHFNPAVSLAIALTNQTKQDVSKFKLKNCPAYMGVQFAGGICAGFVYVFLEAGKSFPLGPAKSYGWAHVAAAEIIFTFLLSYVVLCVATTKTSLKHFYGLAIGSCVTAGGYAIGSVSGGSLNPAVSFGIAFGHVVNGGGIVNATIYMVFEFVGAFLAYILFAQTHSEEVKSQPAN